MVEPSIRNRKAQETRARIAEAALELFMSQGYAETTIDHIAEAAGVSRRTVFHHFPTKDAMLLDNLVLRREVLIERLPGQMILQDCVLSPHQRRATDKSRWRRASSASARVRSMTAAVPVST